MDTFGKRLKHARSRARLTQSQLAERSGLNARHLAHLEQGRYRVPRFGTVDRLAETLGVDANWLHYGDGEMVASPPPATDASQGA